MKTSIQSKAAFQNVGIAHLYAIEQVSQLLSEHPLKNVTTSKPKKKSDT